MMATRKVKQPAHIKQRPKVTPYQAYKKEINRLLEKSQTGGGWEINFTCKEDIGEATARCTYNVLARWVRFSLNTKTQTVQLARATAKHEFAHFITCRLDVLACSRFTTEDEINEELEAISRVFERLV